MSSKPSEMVCFWPNRPPLAIRKRSAYATRPAAPEIAIWIGLMVSKVQVPRVISLELRFGGCDSGRSHSHGNQ